METEEKTLPEAEPGSNQEGKDAGTDLSLEKDPPASSDPLDQMNDPDKLRHEAKKYRGIADRLGKTDDKDEEPAAPDPSDVMTKRDFYKANEKLAIQSVTANQEILENFNAIKEYYTPRRGKDTQKDIEEDLKDAYILWKARNTASDDGTTSLSTITVGAGTGTTPAPKQKSDDDPRFNQVSSPENWYKS